MEVSGAEPFLSPSLPPQSVASGKLNNNRSNEEAKLEGQSTHSKPPQQQERRRSTRVEQRAASAAAAAAEEAAEQEARRERREAVAAWTEAHRGEAKDHSPSFAEFGYTYFAPRAVLKPHLARLVTIAERKHNLWLREWEVDLRCSFQQHDLLRSKLSLGRRKLAQRRSALRAITRALTEEGVKLLASVGEDTAQWRCTAMKLLRSAPGEGSQELHLDVQGMHELLFSRTILFYCTETESTLTLKVPLVATADCYFWSIPEADASPVLRRLTSHMLKPGASSVLTGATPHKAPANPGRTTRYVVFSHWMHSSRYALDTNDQFYIYGAGPCM